MYRIKTMKMCMQIAVCRWGVSRRSTPRNCLWPRVLGQPTFAPSGRLNKKHRAFEMRPLTTVFLLLVSYSPLCIRLGNFL